MMMFRPVRRLLGTILRQALATRGQIIVSTDCVGADKEAAYRLILRRGVRTMLDIGANEGQFALDIRRSGYAGRLISFEPQPAPFRTLAERVAADPVWECHNLGLGEANARLQMHVSGWSVSSSLLPIGKRHIELMPDTVEVSTLSVEVVRLDDWARARGGFGDGPVFIKIDVQGYEGPVLRGAVNTIAVADGVFVELNFADLFEGQSKYFEVMATLDRAGLRFSGLFDVHRDPTTRAALWGDGLFLRD